MSVCNGHELIPDALIIDSPLVGTAGSKVTAAVMPAQEQTGTGGRLRGSFCLIRFAPVGSTGECTANWAGWEIPRPVWMQEPGPTPTPRPPVGSLIGAGPWVHLRLGRGDLDTNCEGLDSRLQ